MSCMNCLVCISDKLINNSLVQQHKAGPGAPKQLSYVTFEAVVASWDELDPEAPLQWSWSSGDTCSHCSLRWPSKPGFTSCYASRLWQPWCPSSQRGRCPVTSEYQLQRRLAWNDSMLLQNIYWMLSTLKFKGKCLDLAWADFKPWLCS